MDKTNDEGGVLPSAGQAVSRPELERLQAARRKPAAERHFTPDGMQPVAADLDRRREERIRHIESQLNGEKDKAVVDFAFGQKKGVARDAFERSRDGDR